MSGQSVPHPVGVALWEFLNEEPQRSRLGGALQAMEQQPYHNGTLNQSGLVALLRKQLAPRVVIPNRNEFGPMTKGRRRFDTQIVECLLAEAGCDSESAQTWMTRLAPQQGLMVEGGGASVADSPTPMTQAALSDQLATLAINPLHRLIDEPWLWLENMDYRVDVHLAPLGSGDRRTRVEVSNTSRRVLSNSTATDGGFWVSFAANEAAYQREFGPDATGCLAREIVPLPSPPGSDWREAIQRDCSAHLVVDGSPVQLAPSSIDGQPDVVRWRTPSGFVPPTERVLVEVEFHYPMDQDRKRFTVTFLSYYCLGSTRIRLTLFAPSEEYELTTDVFYGRALDTPAPEPELRTSADRQLSTFTTGSRSLLWPGSGVHFGWAARRGTQ